jgi:hypothetical protein
MSQLTVVIKRNATTRKACTDYPFTMSPAAAQPYSQSIAKRIYWLDFSRLASHKRALKTLLNA